jgi:hypothetical protein
MSEIKVGVWVVVQHEAILTESPLIGKVTEIAGGKAKVIPYSAIGREDRRPIRFSFSYLHVIQRPRFPLPVSGYSDRLERL